MAGGDWRDAAVVVWNLDLTVPGEKDAIDDGKIKKKRGVGGRLMVDCWNLDDWEKENKDLVFRNLGILILFLCCLCESR